MMVANNSFDLWQKDVFFSAAEEVQESADIMESAYRLWIREKKNGQTGIEELCKELQAALGTAKWQLEEFERAIRLSHKQCGNDSTLTRHKQFVAAIENQISRVESSLLEAFSENGKQPLRWVILNEEERDDLAMFLSGSSQTSQSLNGESIKSRDSTNSSLMENLCVNGTEVPLKVSCSHETSKEARGSTTIPECIINIKEKRSPESIETRIRQSEKLTTGTRRTWSSPNVKSLRIIVPGNEEDEEQEKKKLVTQIKATPKEKGTKPFSWLQRCRDHNQLFEKTGCFQRQLQNPIRIPFSRPIKLTLSLMLIVFLLLPFVVYSS